MFIGMTNHSIDSKGRIVLPAKAREELGETFYVLRCLDSPAIQVLTKESYLSINKQIAALPLKESRYLQFTYAGTASSVTPNAQGRIALPLKLREYAGISDTAIVIGMFDHLEIWDEDTYNEFINSDTDNKQAAIEALGKISLGGGL